MSEDESMNENSPVSCGGRMIFSVFATGSKMSGGLIYVILLSGNSGAYSAALPKRITFSCQVYFK